MKKYLQFFALVSLVFLCFNFSFSTDNKNRKRQNNKDYNALTGSTFESNKKYKQGELIKKLDLVSLPEYGLSFFFLKEPNKEITNNNDIGSILYTKDILDKGELKGKYRIDIFPNAIVPIDSLVTNEIINSVKNEANMPPVVEILEEQQLLYKGFYNIFITKSKYTNYSNNLFVFRSDYLYRSTQGVVRFNFIQHSSGSYLYQNQIDLMVFDNFSWYDYDITDNDLKVAFTSPRGVFQYSSNKSNNSIVFRSFLPNYKSAIDIYKLNATTATINDVANAQFAKIQSNTKLENWNDYMPKGTKNAYLAKSYTTKIAGENYMIYEYVFKINNTYFAATVKNNLEDMDGRGSPLFLKEVEKIFDSIKLVENSQNNTKTNNDDEDIFEYFGY